MENRTRRVNEIDLLRFLAALAVVIFHYAFRGYAADDRTTMPYPLLEPLARYGHLGVELFFMISGFVILMTASRADLRAFIVSRITRLYPAFWACCTITFVSILLLGNGHYNASVVQYLANMTMLSGFVGVPSIDGVYWSLFVEIHFYVMVAAIVALRQVHRAQLLLLGWLAATVALEFYPVSPLRRLLLADYATYFISGALCFLIWQTGAARVRLAGLAVCLVLAIHQTLQSVPRFEAHYDTTLSASVIIALVTGFHAAMLLVALGRTGWIGLRSWAQVGALTYPLYLLHQYVGFMIFNRLYPALDPHLVFWGTVVLMLAASYAIHRYVERPLSPLLRHATEYAWDAPARLLSQAARQVSRLTGNVPRPPGPGVS